MELVQHVMLLMFVVLSISLGLGVHTRGQNGHKSIPFLTVAEGRFRSADSSVFYHRGHREGLPVFFGPRPFRCKGVSFNGRPEGSCHMISLAKVCPMPHCHGAWGEGEKG